MLLAWRRFNPESDTPVYHLSDLPDLPNPTALLSNLIERDISPTAIIANRVSASWLNSEGQAEFLGSHVPDPLEGILEVKPVVRLAVSHLGKKFPSVESSITSAATLLSSTRHLSRPGFPTETLREGSLSRCSRTSLARSQIFDELGLDNRELHADLQKWVWDWHQKLKKRLEAEIQEIIAENKQVQQMGLVGHTDEDAMNINEDEPQITDMGEMDVVALNDEDTMNIDEHDPQITVY
ncbi:hypothetical protein BD769DRAFT_1383289 [Suillus cothurnatus]|nr:hypothetical protein BD769DRAFT_1383289 [Suillus cothurnatus]